MSALKHGFFRTGFMLCDRCVINTRCKHFKPSVECVLEKKAFNRLVRELMNQYELEGVADRILAERAAMYLIRIARAEAYESAMGVSEKSALWGAYISRLDNTLRGLLNDLAVTRAKRLRLEKGDQLLVSVDDLLKKFAKAEAEQKKFRKREVEKRRALLTPRKALLNSWRRECRKLRLTVRRGKANG